MRRVSCAVVLAASLASSSCSLFVRSTQPVVITPSDPQAEVYVDGNLVGKGVTTVALKRNRPHAFMAKVGDRTGTASTTYGVSTTGVVDIIGGVLWLVPFLGVLGPGFYELDQDQIHIAIPSRR